MGVTQDSGRLLVHTYKELVQGDKEGLSTQDIINETKWEPRRINNAFDYIKDLGLIKESMYIGNTKGVYNFTIFGLSPGGINVIDQEATFKRNFNIEVNLLLAKFSWGASEN